MDASTVSAEYTNTIDSSTAFVLTETTYGEALADALERVKAHLNTKFTTMMAAEKNIPEPESPSSSADE
ncbi:hypothetical protein GGH94_001385 [Coemansia aciculifera]|uniref:Uncharacterized protein n=1 Tax=Coemansia aciculifera TaxID=417176 RepID=A0A9W8IKU2_9FUNG|nr:hypothetical protein GGH94_001385 [Coemansia aciculifera]KAJ2874810.1 hypothetical protein GGH93_002117 [Coemansia aciculifera]